MPENTEQPMGSPMLRVGWNSEDYWKDYVEFRFAVRGADDALHVAKPLEFHPVTEDQLMSGLAPAHPPMLILCAKSPEGRACLQSLMDQLWSLGLRPSDMGTPNQIAAVERHLEDFRALLANQLEMSLPGQPARKPPTA